MFYSKIKYTSKNNFELYIFHPVCRMLLTKFCHIDFFVSFVHQKILRTWIMGDENTLGNLRVIR